MDPVEEKPSLQDAMDLLDRASRTTAKARTVKLSSIVDVICIHAYEQGLSQDALLGIVQLASVKTHLDQTSITTLIKNLYPAQKVSATVVITIVGALGQGQGKPSAGTQEGLIKWLTTVHEIIEDTNILSRLYGVLFSLLDTLSIRASLCHILSLITRRKHVKPFRIQQLLELTRNVGNEPALQGLLRVYKDYYPEIILGSTATTRKSFPPPPDTDWIVKIAAIREASRAADHAATGQQNGFKVFRQVSARSNASAIPDVHTYHALETSVTLEGIDNVEDFVEKLDTIEPPGQLISFLTDPLLQKYVDLVSSPMTSARIELWLATCLEDQFDARRNGDRDERHFSNVLEGLLKHTQYSKTIHSITLKFLGAYLPMWNGQDDADVLSNLLAFIPIEHFEDVYESHISKYEQGLGSHKASAHAKLIEFYSSLYQHQVSTISATGAKYKDTYSRVLEKIVAHVSSLSISLILASPAATNSSLISAILGFYEVVSASSVPHIIPILLPPILLLYTLVQNASLTTLSRTCGIIGTYKAAFDQHPKPIKDYFPIAVTDAFNICLRDIYNLFWVARALNFSEVKSHGLHCDPELRNTLGRYVTGLDSQYSVSTAFNVPNSAWLACTCAAAWRLMEEQEIERRGLDKERVTYHQGLITAHALKVLERKGGVNIQWEGPKGYKIFALNWLAERGLSGIRDFMVATVTELKEKAQ